MLRERTLVMPFLLTNREIGPSRLSLLTFSLRYLTYLLTYNGHVSALLIPSSSGRKALPGIVPVPSICKRNLLLEVGNAIG
jgi:hypothetical protein